MDRITGMKLRAYKRYFSEQFKAKAEDILKKSRSLDEADSRFDALVKEFDSAWDEIHNYYIPEGEEDECENEDDD